MWVCVWRRKTDFEISALEVYTLYLFNTSIVVFDEVVKEPFANRGNNPKTERLIKKQMYVGLCNVSDPKNSPPIRASEGQ